MTEIDGNALLSLLMFVRKCEHPARFATPEGLTGDRWCLACGSARVDGSWVAPGWFGAFDKIIAGEPGTPVS